VEQFATTIEARIGAGAYKKNAIKAEKADCHENLKPNIEFEVVEFEPRPNISAYHADIEVTESSDAMPESKDNGPKDEHSLEAKNKMHAFDEEFEPRLNISSCLQ
jgi:hypothetical protein